MACLNARQLADLARGAGFGDDQMVTMVAIALAEGARCRPSSDSELSVGGRLRTGVRSDSVGDGGDSIGPWQINRANWTGEFNARTLKDPATNARAAKAVYDRQGYRAWSVYKNGRYRGHLDEAKVGTFVTGGGPTPAREAVDVVFDAATGQLQILGQVWDVISATAQWLGDPQNWLRILLVTGGGVLGVVAIQIALSGQTRKLARTVVGGTPTKKIVQKAVKGKGS